MKKEHESCESVAMSMIDQLEAIAAQMQAKTAKCTQIRSTKESPGDELK